MPVPLSEMQASSLDSSVTMNNASSNVCATTFVTSSPVVSVKPNVSPKPISDSDEPGKKRKRERSGSLSGLSQDMGRRVSALYGLSRCYWTLFVCYLPIPNHPGIITLTHQLINPRPLSLPIWLASGRPGETCPFHLTCLTCLTNLSCFAYVACHG